MPRSRERGIKDRIRGRVRGKKKGRRKGERKKIEGKNRVQEFSHTRY